jgi:hypothetical protein
MLKMIKIRDKCKVQKDFKITQHHKIDHNISKHITDMRVVAHLNLPT